MKTPINATKDTSAKQAAGDLTCDRQIGRPALQRGRGYRLSGWNHVKNDSKVRV